jgi:hypothetical protein
MPGENISLIREKLIELYLETKVRKNSEVNYIYNLIILFID